MKVGEQGERGSAGVNAEVFPGSVSWQMEWTPRYLKCSQIIWHISNWHKAVLAELPTAAGTFTAVFLHLALPTATATQQVFPQAQCVWQLQPFNIIAGIHFSPPQQHCLALLPRGQHGNGDS